MCGDEGIISEEKGSACVVDKIIEVKEGVWQIRLLIR